jgi:hypothetical protein
MKYAICAALGLATLGGVKAASADTCRDVDIVVENNFTQNGSPIQIKVIDFDYFDNTEGKWRDEAWNSNTIVAPGDTILYAESRNLSFVGGESGTVIRVQFQYLTANNGWSATLDALSAPFHCDRGDQVTVPVNGFAPAL